MPGEKHLRLQVAGGYSGTGNPALEVWSFNLRLALVFGGIDDLGTFPSNWSVEPQFATTTEATYTTDATWYAKGPTPSTFDPTDYLKDQVEPAVAAFIAGWKFSSRAEVRKISLYPCDTTGNSIDGNFASLTYTSSFPHGTGTNIMPLENSVVVGWQTNRLGPRGKGRIYTPVPGTNVLDADGNLAAGERLDLGSAAADFIAALQYYPALPDPSAHVRAVVTGPTPKPGIPAYTQYATILKTRVGAVIDTQRRRRNAETEDYTVTDVTF